MLEKIIFIRSEFNWELIGNKKLIRMFFLFFAEYLVFDFIDEDVHGNPYNLKCYSTNAAAIEFIDGERELLRVSDLYVHDGSTDVIISYALFRKIVTTFMEFDNLYGYYWSDTADRIEIEIDIDTDYFMVCVTPSAIIPKNMHIVTYKQSLKKTKP